MSLLQDVQKLARRNPDGIRKHLNPILRKAKVKKDEECMKKYQTNKGDFKGGKGEAFDNCVKAFKECSDAKNPEGMCAYIGRQHGKIKSAVLAPTAKLAAQTAYHCARKLGETPEVSLIFARMAYRQHGK